MAKKARDSEWIRQCFLLPEHAYADVATAARRIYTTADQKFTDTTLGGNWALNALPQFTRHADQKRKGIYSGSMGMGLFYSEIIDDNAQLIHVRLGMPKFNSLYRFFSNFYSAQAGSLARTGRAGGAFFQLGKVVGTVVSLPLWPLSFAGSAIRFFADRPATTYYSLSPKMPLYWNAFATMVNGVAVNLGVIPRVWTDQQASLFDPDTRFRSDDVARFHKLLPGVIRRDGGFDIYAVANRAQRLANAYYEAMENETNKVGNPEQLTAAMRRMATTNVAALDPGKNSLEDYLKEYLDSPEGFKDENNPVSGEFMDVDKRERSYLESISDFFMGEARMGSDFVTWRVDHTGVQTESFNSSVKEAGITGTINSMSGEARSKRFNFADGNIDSAGITQWAADAARQFMTGIAVKFDMQGIAALAGNAFVDIPQVWDTSSADVNRSTFTIPLRSPYGHDYSRMVNLLIPMCGLLCMALPISTGAQSWSSPFILELFNKGRTRIRTGIVDSISVQRGVGDVGWTPDGKFLGVDVTLSIIDLSQVVHMPINASLDPLEQAWKVAAAGVGSGVATVANALGADLNVQAVGTGTGAAAASILRSSYTEDNLLSDMMTVWGSLPMEAQVNSLRKLRLNLTRQMADAEQWKSPAHLVNWAMGGISGDLLKAISLRTNRD